jgi:short-subunit dehydrogenase
MTKTILITGAGSGFGKGASLELARRGHRVIATTETEEQADALRTDYPQLIVEKIDIATTDVQKAAQWEIDVLINNAGLGQSGPLADFPQDRMRRMLEVNILGAFAMTQAVLEQMFSRKSGRILIVSSIAGLITVPGFGAYCMCKHALEAMGKTLRAELEQVGIDVALVNAGPFETGFNDSMAASMWNWFDSSSLHWDTADLFKATGAAITKQQFDPEDVYLFLADLAEADSIELQNLIPKDVLENF